MSWDKIFNFTDYSELLPLVHNSLLAGSSSASWAA